MTQLLLMLLFVGSLVILLRESFGFSKSDATQSIWNHKFFKKKHKQLSRFFNQLGVDERVSHWVEGTALFFLGSLIGLLTLPFEIGVLFLIVFVLYVMLLKQRWDFIQGKIHDELIDLTSVLSLSLRAGQDFWSALKMYCSQNNNRLSKECQNSLNLLRLGKDRSGVFDEMQEKYPITYDFVAALKLNENQGTPLGQVMAQQSENLKNKKLMLIEERLQKLPIILLGPLILCIFPNVFIVLLGPFLLSIL